MRALRIAVVACASIAPLLCAPAVSAQDDVAINGTYTAFSDGVWAKTNERFHDEVPVTSTWTVTTSCATYQDCTGTVVSDQGWTAPIRYTSGQWRVARALPEWQTCPDGTTAPGEQAFTFWPPRQDSGPSKLVGWDRTTGPSGACGVNRWLNISMPFTLTLVP